MFNTCSDTGRRCSEPVRLQLRSCFPFIFLIERNENGPTCRLESPAVHRAGWESKLSVRIGWLYGAYKTESSLSFIYLFFHLPFKLCAVHS